MRGTVICPACGMAVHYDPDEGPLAALAVHLCWEDDGDGEREIHGMGSWTTTPLGWLCTCGWHTPSTPPKHRRRSATLWQDEQIAMHILGDLELHVVMAHYKRVGVV